MTLTIILGAKEEGRLGEGLTPGNSHTTGDGSLEG